jgi:hypothetical protein
MKKSSVFHSEVRKYRASKVKSLHLLDSEFNCRSSQHTKLILNCCFVTLVMPWSVGFLKITCSRWQTFHYDIYWTGQLSGTFNTVVKNTIYCLFLVRTLVSRAIKQSSGFTQVIHADFLLVHLHAMLFTLFWTNDVFFFRDYHSKKTYICHYV